MENYIIIHEYMVRDLGLSGNKLIVYAVIAGFSQDGKSRFCGSVPYLTKWTGTSRRAVVEILQSLTESGLIRRIETEPGTPNFYQTVYPAGSEETSRGGVKKLHGGSEETSPNNITNNIDINNKEKSIKQKRKEFVSLTDEEMHELLTKYGATLTDAFLEKLNNYKGASGRTYKSDYMALKSWVIAEVLRNRTASPGRETATEHAIRVRNEILGK